jgi:hypothetical protein
MQVRDRLMRYPHIGTGVLLDLLRMAMRMSDGRKSIERRFGKDGRHAFRPLHNGSSWHISDVRLPAVDDCLGLKSGLRRRML